MRGFGLPLLPTQVAPWGGRAGPRYRTRAGRGDARSPRHRLAGTLRLPQLCVEVREAANRQAE